MAVQQYSVICEAAFQYLQEEGAGSNVTSITILNNKAQQFVPWQQHFAQAHRDQAAIHVGQRKHVEKSHGYVQLRGSK